MSRSCEHRLTERVGAVSEGDWAPFRFQITPDRSLAD